MQRALRFSVTAGIALLGVSGIAITPVTPTASPGQVRAVKLIDNVADIMAGSGTPIPSDSYIEHDFDVFVKTLDDGTFQDYTPQGVDYPAGNYGLYTGVKSLPLDTSEAQGTEILDKTIATQVADGSDVIMKGQSQSSTVAGMTMTELAAQHVPSSDVSFVLTGDPNLPNGGLFERMDGLALPSLGITFNGATPSDLYPTTIYTLEYDGFADVCRYPIDFVCDINSLAGIEFVHPTYSTDVTPEQLASAIQLPTVGDTMTTYYMMPTADLPLLDPVRDIPLIGNPIADLLQPDLKVLVNLGYGDPDYGWSQGPANVPTEFGLFPSLSELEKVPALLETGTQQGITDFGNAISSEVSSFTSDPSAALSGMLGDLTSGASTTTSTTDMLSALSPTDLVNDLTNVIDALSGATSSAYATLLPTADVLNALLTSMPTYDLSLFTQGIDAGNLLEAVGQPIATDTYLIPLAAAFELFSVIGQASTVASDLSSIFP